MAVSKRLIIVGLIALFILEISCTGDTNQESSESTQSEDGTDKDTTKADSKDNGDSGSSDSKDNGDTGSSDSKDNGDSGSSDSLDNGDSGSSDSKDNGDTGSSDSKDNGDSGSSDSLDNGDSGSSDSKDNGDSGSSDSKDNGDSGSSDSLDNGDSGSSDSKDNGDSGSSDSKDNGDSGSSDSLDNGDSGSSDSKDNGDSGSSDSQDKGDKESSDSQDKGGSSGSSESSDSDEGSEGECAITGDPHLMTFDDLNCTVHADVPCDYYLVQHDDFAVIGKLTNCFRPQASCIDMIQIDCEDETWFLDQNYAVTDKSGAAINVPFVSNSVEMKQIGNKVVVYLPNGVTVAWNGERNVFVWLPKRFKNKVEGLCGNFDGKSYNDWGSCTNPSQYKVDSSCQAR